MWKIFKAFEPSEKVTKARQVETALAKFRVAFHNGMYNATTMLLGEGNITIKINHTVWFDGEWEDDGFTIEHEDAHNRKCTLLNFKRECFQSTGANIMNILENDADIIELLDKILQRLDLKLAMKRTHILRSLDTFKRI